MTLVNGLDSSLVRESLSVTRTPRLPGDHCAPQTVGTDRKTVRESIQNLLNSGVGIIVICPGVMTICDPCIFERGWI